MTGGWAATNTLRETLPKRAERHRVEKGIEYVYGHKPWHADSIDAAHDALALVEAALDAGNEVAEAHKDFRFVCSRDDTEALDVLAAALRAVREGK